MFKLFKLIVLFWNVLMVFAIGPKGLKNQEVAPNEVRTCFEGYLLYSDGNCVQEINEDPIPVCVEGKSNERFRIVKALQAIGWLPCVSRDR